MELKVEEILEMGVFVVETRWVINKKLLEVCYCNLK